MAALDAAVCEAAFPNGVGGGDHCAVDNLAVSTVDPNWVYASIGVFNAQNQPENDGSTVILNLSTHQLIGPTDSGFCGGGEGGTGSGVPVTGFSSVPANVVAGFGLSLCSRATTTTKAGPAKVTTTTAATVPAALAPFVDSWGAHEIGLVIDKTGTGHMTYQDLTLCPNCSFADAPTGTLVFVLTTVKNGVANGTVTASSDPRNWTVGLPVVATLTAGSPGQILNLGIGGKPVSPLCNGTSAGQCGS